MVAVYDALTCGAMVRAISAPRCTSACALLAYAAMVAARRGRGCKQLYRRAVSDRGTAAPRKRAVQHRCRAPESWFRQTAVAPGLHHLR
jgi:hypothetical protein